MMEALSSQPMNQLQAAVAARKDATPSAEDLLARARPEGTFDEDAAMEAAREYESTFVSMLVETMFQGVKTDGPFSGGHGEGVFRSMLNQEYSKQLVERGGMGLADNILAELRKMQEVG